MLSWKPRAIPVDTTSLWGRGRQARPLRPSDTGRCAPPAVCLAAGVLGGGLLRPRPDLGAN